MKWWLIAGVILLLLAGQMYQADRISTTIHCLGATFLSSSVDGSGQSYHSSLFTDNRADITRNLVTGRGVDSTVKISGNGSFGVDEYQGRIHYPADGDLICLIQPAREDPGTYGEITASGLFRSGEYLSTRSLRNESSGSRTEVNGTGMIVMNSRSGTGERSSEFRTYATGPMQVAEDLRLGGR